MKYKKSSLETLIDVFSYIFILMLTLLALYPIWHVAVASISNPTLLMQHSGPVFYPLGFSLEAYKAVLRNPSIINGYLNTIFYVGVGTLINLVLTTLGAYVLSRKNFFWGGPIMMMILFTMFFSGGMIPTFLLVESMGLVDSRLALILPMAVNTFNLIIMRTAFAAVPESLGESAAIEGANDFQILTRIYIPVSKAVIAVMVLYYAVGHWNSWFPALLYLRTRSLYPLQLILREILINNQLDNMRQNIDFTDIGSIGETIKYATIMVATIPILLIYPFLQKYFVKGIMIGSVKG